MTPNNNVLVSGAQHNGSLFAQNAEQSPQYSSLHPLTHIVTVFFPCNGNFQAPLYVNTLCQQKRDLNLCKFNKSFYLNPDSGVA